MLARQEALGGVVLAVERRGRAMLPVPLDVSQERAVPAGTRFAPTLPVQDELIHEAQRERCWDTGLLQPPQAGIRRLPVPRDGVRGNTLALSGVGFFPNPFFNRFCVVGRWCCARRWRGSLRRW